MSFGELAVSAFATPKKNGEIHFRELDETLSIKFVTSYMLSIECNKLEVFDNSGKSTCEIAGRSSCKLRTFVIYKAKKPLLNKFTFLNSPQVEIKQKIECIRGIFDLFINDNMFCLGFYVDYELKRVVFDTTAFSPGCYNDCSAHGFIALNKFRQVIFQTTDVSFGSLGINSPIEV